MLRKSGHGSTELFKSVTVLRTFLLASAAILVVAAVALSSTLSKGLRTEALEDNARDVHGYTTAVLAPTLVRGDRVVVTPRGRRQLRQLERLHPDVRGLSIWSSSGRLLFSTSRPGRVGTRARSGSVRQAIRSGRPRAELDTAPAGAAVVEVWSPLRSSKGRLVGAAEVELDERVLEQAVSGFRGAIWLAVALVFVALWLALALVVRGASSGLRRQNSKLADSARGLEQTLIETIETLNAAVEARDPYTAGHSQRVRRVALAVGHELGVSAERLRVLGTSALFHDIGKIGMPDSILTKPELLSRAESAIMRRHVTAGAEIVSRITWLQDAVPGILYHHERWDGLGYPEGKSGEDIPLEAAIIGLADAWDAMTTDRPYAVALQLGEAMMQLRAGRGKQFNPAVVDAFLNVAKRHPAEVLPPEEPTASVAVV